jgi:hypothetical protein
MKNSLQNKLKNYTTLTASIAAISNSSFGAVQINTINYIGGWGDIYNIDINNDGILDYRFTNYLDSGIFGTYFVAFKFYGLDSQNKAVADSPGYVKALNNGSIVSFGQNFSFFYGSYQCFIRSLNGQVDNFYTIGLVSSVDKFIGVKFDISGNTHYGWIRLRGITENLDQWMIVDAGWEDVPDTPITIDAPLSSLSTKENNQFDFSIVANDNILEINSEHRNSALSVYDLNGKLVLSKMLLSNHEQMPFNFPKGFYIVRLTNKGRIASKKVYIE